MVCLTMRNFCCCTINSLQELNPDFPYDTYASFDLDELDELDESECLAEFRVRKRDILALSDIIQCDQ